MSYFDSDVKEMLEIYLLETKQLVGQLSAILLDAEKNNAFKPEELHAIFRIMHTMKGSSAMMGLKELSSMSHKLENIFSYYREQYGELQHVDTELFNLLFQASDYIEQELERMTQEDYVPERTEEIEKTAEIYLRTLTDKPAVKPDVSKTEVETQIETQIETEPSSAVPLNLADEPGTLVRVKLENNCRMENVRAYMLLRQIGGLCTKVLSYPEHPERDQDSSEDIRLNGIWILFESDRKAEVLDTLKRGMFVEKCEEVAGRKTEFQEPKKIKENIFLNVKSDRLDRLQNLAGELMIQMLTLDSQLESAGLTEVREGTAHQISRLVSEVEYTIMEMRMVPVSKMIPKLRRILRGICKEQGKEAELEIRCSDVEADKSVVEYMSEALMHIIRNAVDHGLETPEEREAAGKPAKGKVIFEVNTRVGELRISLSDDGRGINEEKVRQRARERGLFKRPEEEYDFQEICNFILLPGFSTNKDITEYSGRGVGLDVVRTIIENAGGHVRIASEEGKGSTFTLMLPITLSTVECIRFKVGEYRFSMPARHVFRFLRYDDCKQNMQKIDGKDYTAYEGRMVPFIDLRQLFHLEGEASDNTIVIYMKSNDREGCILADSMYRQKRIVIKPLPALFGVEFRYESGISGCSIMGNGCICAALDTELIISRYEGG